MQTAIAIANLIVAMAALYLGLFLAIERLPAAVSLLTIAAAFIVGAIQSPFLRKHAPEYGGLWETIGFLWCVVGLAFLIR